MNRGFTLMEICVALAVLSAGIVVFGRFLDGFNRLRSLERDEARMVLETARAVEYFIQNPPACRDTSFTFGASVQVTVQTLLGPKPLAWLSASSVTPSPQTTPKDPVFRRLIRCVKD